jgi:hypothetical protein
VSLRCWPHCLEILSAAEVAADLSPAHMTVRRLRQRDQVVLVACASDTETVGVVAGRGVPRSLHPCCGVQASSAHTCRFAVHHF